MQLLKRDMCNNSWASASSPLSLTMLLTGGISSSPSLAARVQARHGDGDTGGAARGGRVALRALSAGHTEVSGGRLT